MKEGTFLTKLATVLAVVTASVIVIMPFHAVVTTWLASNFNHFDLFRIWKDLLLVPLGLGSLWLLRDRGVREQLRPFARLLYLIIFYGLLGLLLGVWALHAHRVNLNALLYGWLTDLRFLALFFIALIVSTHVPLKRHWQQLLLVPAAIVVTFGLLQHFVLPHDFLRHFGYGPRTLPVYETVDQKLSFVRLQSTLRGPNPLGAYLVLIITALVGLILSRSHKNRRPSLAMFLAGSLIVLLYTYSRSAWVGTAIAVALVVWLLVTNTRTRRWLLLAGASILLVIAAGILLLRHNARIEDTFFHTSQYSQSSKSSNQLRGSALKGGLKDVVHEPLGRGPGTAGPASARNDHPARIAEDYYLQVGQEVGILGLAVFVAINVYVAYYLWRERHDTLSAILLASFAGISFINLLSHAWADDTLSLVWWGLAGIALGSSGGILNANKLKKYEKTKKVPAP